MSNFGRLVSERLASKIQEHEKQSRCGRIDLVLADYHVASPTDAKIMVEYSRERGKPSPSQVGKWVVASFDGQLQLNIKTLRDHPEIGAVTAMVHSNYLPQPVSRTASMVKIAGNRYMDKNENVWAVQESEDGGKFLVRASDEDIAAILEERVTRQREGRYASTSVDLGMLKTAGIAELAVGDEVLYIEPGNIMQKTGTISSVGKDQVSIKGASGPIPRSLVVDVVDKNATDKKKMEKDIADMLVEYYFAGDNKVRKEFKID